MNCDLGSRSEFFRLAGRRLPDEPESESELTIVANAVMARVGQPAGDGLFLRESVRTLRDGAEW